MEDDDELEILRRAQRNIQEHMDRMGVKDEMAYCVYRTPLSESDALDGLGRIVDFKTEDSKKLVLVIGPGGYSGIARNLVDIIKREMNTHQIDQIEIVDEAHHAVPSKANESKPDVADYIVLPGKRFGRTNVRSFYEQTTVLNRAARRGNKGERGKQWKQKIGKRSAK